MDIEKFSRMISSKSKDELQTILKNVRSKNAPEHEELVLKELDGRFLGWEKPKKMVAGGRTPNRAVYKGKEAAFDTAKAGFIWLVEQMVLDGKQHFIKQDERLEIAASRKRKYLARSPKLLFSSSEHLAEDENNYAKLPYGWYLNVNLNNKLKFEVLARIAWVVNVKFPDDWDWAVEANTSDFGMRRSQQEELQKIHEFLQELLEESSQGKRS